MKPCLVTIFACWCALLASPPISNAIAAESPAANAPLHFAPGSNFDAQGRFSPGRAGFSLADVVSREQLEALPKGVKGLVWIDLCNGSDSDFVSRIGAFYGARNLFGFYLMDEPDPSGRWKRACPAHFLKAETDWIHARMPAAKTFITLMNMGSSEAPTFRDTYTLANTHVDLYGVGPYPCRHRWATCDLDMIDHFVIAATEAGIDRDRIVPIFQAFGSGKWRDEAGDSYAVPTPEQVRSILDRWSTLVPSPTFDYAYSWGSQSDDRSLATDEGMQAIFRQHNDAGGINSPTVSSPRPDGHP